MIKSFNRKIVCEPYKAKAGLKSKINRGVAVVQQKTEVIGLKVLIDAKVDNELQLKTGDIIYVKEETLHTVKSYQNALECPDIKEPFVIVDFGHVDFVKVNKNGK